MVRNIIIDTESPDPHHFLLGVILQPHLHVMSWINHVDVLLINSGELIGAPSRNQNRNEGHTTQAVAANQPTVDSSTCYFIQHLLTKHMLCVSLFLGALE